MMMRKYGSVVFAVQTDPESYCYKVSSSFQICKSNLGGGSDKVTCNSDFAESANSSTDFALVFGQAVSEDLADIRGRNLSIRMV